MDVLVNSHPFLLSYEKRAAPQSCCPRGSAYNTKYGHRGLAI